MFFLKESAALVLGISPMDWMWVSSHILSNSAFSERAACSQAREPGILGPYLEIRSSVRSKTSLT